MPHRPRRPGWPAAVLLGLIAPAAAVPACAPGRRRITPTTTGSDLRALPRGRMAPPPFPGSSLARVDRAGPATGDPAATTAAATRDQPVR